MKWKYVSDKGELRQQVYQLRRAFDDRLLPIYMFESVRDYVLYGAPIGSFLSALFGNDLYRCFQYGDPQNIDSLREWVMLLVNDLPSACWGSKEVIASWTGLVQPTLKESVQCD